MSDAATQTNETAPMTPRTGRRVLREARGLLKRARKRLPDERAAEVQSALDALREAVASGDRQLIGEAASRVDALSELHLSFVRKGRVREYVESIGTAILVALLLRAFVVEAFQIPSGSMEPTLLIGDHLFVAKYSFGIRIPFTTKYLVRWGELERGDIVVFEYPLDEVKTQDDIANVVQQLEGYHQVNDGYPESLDELRDPVSGQGLDESERTDAWGRQLRYAAVDQGFEVRSAGADGEFGTWDDLTSDNGTFPGGNANCIAGIDLRVARDYIKRVVGLPGDTVELVDNVVHLNGEPLAYTEGEPVRVGRGLPVLDRVETLGDTEHIVRSFEPRASAGPFEVRPGHMFVLGDNRDNSNDSRCWGQVPMSNIKGQAMFIFFSRDRTGDGGIRFERIFDPVR